MNKQINYSKKKYRGVYKHHKGWRFRLSFEKVLYNGYGYKSAKDAALAYDEVAKAKLGIFAKVNFK